MIHQKLDFGPPSYGLQTEKVEFRTVVRKWTVQNVNIIFHFGPVSHRTCESQAVTDMKADFHSFGLS